MRKTGLLTTTVAVALAGALLLGAASSGAQQASHHGAHTGGAASAQGADSPSSKAFAAASQKMHAAMAVPLTGDADVDFVRGMIPHHQGAVEMAKIVLEHGKDPEVRKLAQDVVAAQEAEIAFMTGWLKTKGK
jgi:uncharacterized protein (DUF305 family)